MARLRDVAGPSAVAAIGGLVALAALTATVRGAADADPPAPREIMVTTGDGGTVVADLYGPDGAPGVVLAHGAVFDKGSWRPLAQHLAARGDAVLAIDFRGYGHSAGGGTPETRVEDVLAAVQELRRRGAPRVAVIGGSMGAGAAAAAAVRAPGEIARLVLLSPPGISDPAALHLPTLFVACAEEPGAARVRTDHAGAPGPKRLVVLPGKAHAQHIFATDQAGALREAIDRFLE